MYDGSLISTDIPTNDLENLSQDVRDHIIAARLKAQSIQGKIEPEHINGYPDLIQRLELILENARESFEAQKVMDQLAHQPVVLPKQIPKKVSVWKFVKEYFSI